MISIVIPAYNEEKTLGFLLTSLCKQNTKKPFEVIVVDNNSTDRTKAVANSFKDRLPLLVIFEKQKGRGPARKAGFEKAKGEIILSTDADAKVPSHWIDTMVEPFTDASVLAVTGTCKIIDLNRFDNAVFNFLQPHLMQGYKLIWGHFWLTGSNFAIRKDIYERAGGFDTTLNAMEDIHLSPKVSTMGKVIFTHAIPVTVSGRRFEDNLVKGLLEYGWSFAGYRMRRRQSAHLSDSR